MLTVLMPTYNNGPYIEESIKSILNQTYSKFELLIIDDGSTDNTEFAVSKFNDSRIRYIKKKHEGLAATLNFGLKTAKYDWIARMDADDISHPRRLEKQISIVHKKRNFVSCSWSAYFDNKGIRFTVETPEDNDELKKKLSLHCYINHSSVIYNRNIILSKGGYNTKLSVYEDYELWLRILNDVTFEVVPEYLIFTRINKQSLSRKDFADKKRIILDAQKKYYSLDSNSNFNRYEKTEISGWREFFYGDKNNARKIFAALKLRVIIKPKILFAIIITLFTQQFVNVFIINTFKYKLVYYSNYYNVSYKNARGVLKSFCYN